MNKAPFLYGLGFGTLPDFPGRVFFVAPGAVTYFIGGIAYVGGDNNDGLDPRRATATIQKAVTYASVPGDYTASGAAFTAPAGDVILLLPGSHAPTAAVALNVPGLNVVGFLGDWYANPQQGLVTVTAPAALAAFAITAADCELGQLNIVPATTAAAVTISAAGSRTHIHDCTFDMETPAADTGTKAITIAAAVRVTIERCQINCNKAQGPAIDATASINCVIQNCNFSLRGNATWANCILAGAATIGLQVRNCNFEVSGTGAMTAAIDGTGATIAKGVMMIYNNFDNLCTVPIDNFGAGQATLIQNYKAGVGAADGGTLIVAIT